MPPKADVNRVGNFRFTHTGDQDRTEQKGPELAVGIPKSRLDWAPKLKGALRKIQELGYGPRTREARKRAEPRHFVGKPDNSSRMLKEKDNIGWGGRIQIPATTY